MEQGIKPDKIAWEDSPETLKSYRSVRYTSTMRCYQDKGPETSSTTAILTTNSLIYDNLLIAAAEPLLMARIVLEFVEEIAAIMQVNVQQKKRSIIFKAKMLKMMTSMLGLFQKTSVKIYSAKTIEVY